MGIIDEDGRGSRCRNWLALATLLACWGAEARLPEAVCAAGREGGGADAAGPGGSAWCAARTAAPVPARPHQYFEISTSS